MTVDRNSVAGKLQVGLAAAAVLAAGRGAHAAAWFQLRRAASGAHLHGYAYRTVFGQGRAGLACAAAGYCGEAALRLGVAA